LAMVACVQCTHVQHRRDGSSERVRGWMDHRCIDRSSRAAPR
jgi:hypothetical protein